MSRRGPTRGTSAVVFADVVRELQSIAAMAEGSDDLRIVSACRRAQSLADRLHQQFLEDVLGEGSPAGRDARIA